MGREPRWQKVEAVRLTDEALPPQQKGANTMAIKIKGPGDRGVVGAVNVYLPDVYPDGWEVV